MDHELRQRILDAFGFEGEADLDDGDGYAEARADFRAREDQFRAELPSRMERARQDATALLRAHGALPAGLEFAWE